MALKRGREVDLSVERELLDTSGVPRRLRVSARFLLDEGAEAPTAADAGRAISQLDRELEGAAAQAGFRVPSARVDRSPTELLETYRPRQSQLVDALLADGEVSEAEAAILRASLPPAQGSPPSPTQGPMSGRAPVSETDRPLAAMPLSVDRAPSSPRPVHELLATFQIATLKQAGAIRARRQISYDEYMSLKRHFGGATTEPTPTS